MNKRLLLLCTGVIFTGTSAMAAATGTFKTYREGTSQVSSYVKISESGGKLSGTILCVVGPDGKVDPDATCLVGTCKGKKWTGMRFMWDVAKKSPGVYEDGQVIRGKDGKIYGVDVKELNGGAKLEIKGYMKMMGSKVGGGAAFFDRVSSTPCK